VGRNNAVVIKQASPVFYGRPGDTHIIVISLCAERKIRQRRKIARYGELRLLLLSWPALIRWSALQPNPKKEYTMKYLVTLFLVATALFMALAFAGCQDSGGGYRPPAVVAD